ncbi:pilus assembly protein [Vibrio cholerae]|uniref:hypothetical protein n=1 Tax=Vibrio cholerae TaxID=666 RepID=UPI0002A396B7|nr:hypothetical protein [Vibrio cholerae]EGR1041486.1 pilus assembly protein [Vibrio cholerae]EJL6880460.1 pilus assembly protein [Vibrio cholerae]EJL6983875.1 pilus assembly protein [Vibrio cholerae]EKG0005863.1 pilus assembly protein [Vibrio cholerae]EKG0018379.1 pilus assembly protein [Vibrio cholerae]
MKLDNLKLNTPNLGNIKQALAGSERKIFYIALAVCSLLIAGAAGGYWYYQDQQEQERLAAEQRAAQQKAQKISSIRSFYTTTFNGGDLGSLVKQHDALRQQQLLLRNTGLNPSAANCDGAQCNLQFLFEPGSVFNVPVLTQDEQDFLGSFSEEGIEYTGLPSYFNQHPYLEKYQGNEEIVAPSCNDVINYVYSYNSINPYKLEMTSLPSSSVIDEEIKYPELKPYGLLAGDWQLSVPGSSELLSFTASWPYGENLLISNMEWAPDNITVKGKLVCKK